MSNSGQVFRVGDSVWNSLWPVSAYQHLLAAAVEHLQHQREQGQRYVTVDAAKLAALSRPIATSGATPVAVDGTGPAAAAACANLAELRAQALACTQWQKACKNMRRREVRSSSGGKQQTDTLNGRA